MRPSGYLRWDIRQLAKAMHLTKDEVKRYFTDGRRVSFLVDRRIAREVLHGQLPIDEGKPHDVIDAKQQKWEVRSVTKHGVYFCPSYMVGSQRKFNGKGFENKLKAISGYVIADVASFPKVPYWIIPASVVAMWWENGELGSKQKSHEAKR
jgi:hypothetical protein